MDLAAALAPSHSDRRPWVVARLLAVDTATNRAQVSVDGSPAVWLPFAPGTYTNVTTVVVLRDPANSGAGQFVVCPYYQEAPEVVPPPPGDPVLAPATTATAVIRPSGSATYRHIRGAWDRWNVDLYGGRTDVYQGDAYGSGPLTGLAWYGDQVVNLGALEILSVSVSTPRPTGSGNMVLQGAPHAARPAGAPAPSGESASGGSSVLLSAAMREALRTGAAKSLAAVGGSYRSSYGSAHPSGMALSITYMRAA